MPLPHLLVLSPSADLYGSDRSLLAALPTIIERFDTTVAFATDGPAVEEVASLGAEVVHTVDWALRRRGLSPQAAPATALRALRASRQLRRIHRQRPFELVYANTVANALIPLLPTVVGAPLVVHVREVPRDRGRLALVLFGALDRSADLVVCNSHFTAECVRSLAPRLGERITVVHNGIDSFEAADPGPDDGVLDVSCVGRIHPKKGQGTLIEAARIAANDGHKWRLHFFGDALPEHEELAGELRRAVAHAGLEDRTHWYGYQRDVRALYNGMDVAVVPSIFPEEFSRVAVEGQLAGLPVVATGPGGPSEIVEDGVTGTIVPPENAPALAAALIALEDGARRRSWGEAGRQRMLSHFTTEQYASAVADTLTGALSLTASRRLRFR